MFWWVLDPRELLDMSVTVSLEKNWRYSTIWFLFVKQAAGAGTAAAERDLYPDSAPREGAPQRRLDIRYVQVATAPPRHSRFAL